MREEILRKIRELAERNGGQPPGRQVFERETGISQPTWCGVYWARWGDALVEAGYSPNALTGQMAEGEFFERLAGAVRHYQRVPTEAEFRMYRRIKPAFPSHSTISNRFSSKAELVDRLRSWAEGHAGFADVASLLPARSSAPPPTKANRVSEGFVYLIGSGPHFKIGRSDELERRVKQIRVALPEAATLIHAIKTDDPPGIEAYWHRRFADKRAGGEWFRLTPSDLAAFKRRKYQ